MPIINSLLDRRLPQIIGSYVIACITLIGALDWLCSRYNLSDIYVNIAIFCAATILPSIILIAYYHGRPGKDKWMMIEKIFIPVNILFIFFYLLSSDWLDSSGNMKKDTVADNFLIMISSNDQFFEYMKKTDEWMDIKNEIQNFGKVKDSDLNKIIKYVSISLKQKFINSDIKLYFPETDSEKEMLTLLPPSNYIMHVIDDSLLNEKEIYKNKTYAAVNYFNEKFNTKIDKILKIDLFWFTPKEKKHIDIISFDYTRYRSYQKKDKTLGVSYSFSEGDWYDVNVIEDDNIEYDIFNLLHADIIENRYGEYIGSIDEILDSNLVTIKLYNLDLLDGMRLKAVRKYLLSKTTIKEELDYQINDYETRNKYFNNNQEEIIDWYEISGDLEKQYGSNDSMKQLVIRQLTDELDSLKNNYYDIIDKYEKGGQWSSFEYGFTYDLEILNIQDSIATAKITKFDFPFLIPRIGDKIRLKE